ncbi:hypothetical protein KZ326_04060 [Glaesserella parasuis]|nr:hypothetical protein [Glaesserella parasuis]
MINESNKEAILNGACGISRDGYKCRYVGKNESSELPYLFVYYKSNGIVKDIVSISEQFRYLTDREHEFDVIDLWENRVELFDLERALNGEPLIDLHNNEKCWLYKSHRNDNLIIEYENTDSHLENIEPLEYLHNDLDLSKCFSMWKEPEPNTVTLTLPCPLKEPKDEMWFLHLEGVVRSTYNKNIPLDAFKKMPYFGSKEDAQAWFDAMRDNRR